MHERTITKIGRGLSLLALSALASAQEPSPCSADQKGACARQLRSGQRAAKPWL